MKTLIPIPSDEEALAQIQSRCGKCGAPVILHFVPSDDEDPQPPKPVPFNPVPISVYRLQSDGSAVPMEGEFLTCHWEECPGKVCRE